MSNAIARKIETIEQKGGMRSADVANILGTRPETVSRWNQGKAFPRGETERMLLELDYIVEQLSDFYSPIESRLWLYSRQKLLGSERPVDLIQRGDTDRVILLLDQLRDSVYI
jgi:transcriptional regulator with XRE-family HTH domain